MHVPLQVSLSLRFPRFPGTPRRSRRPRLGLSLSRSVRNGPARCFWRPPSAGRQPGAASVRGDGKRAGGRGAGHPGRSELMGWLLPPLGKVGLSLLGPVFQGDLCVRPRDRRQVVPPRPARSALTFVGHTAVPGVQGGCGSCSRPSPAPQGVWVQDSCRRASAALLGEVRGARRPCPGLGSGTR